MKGERTLHLTSDQAEKKVEIWQDNKVYKSGTSMMDMCLQRQRWLGHICINTLRSVHVMITMSHSLMEFIFIFEYVNCDINFM